MKFQEAPATIFGLENRVQKGSQKIRYVENRPDIDVWSMLGRCWTDLESILDLFLKGSWRHVQTSWVRCRALVSVLRAPVAACSVAVLTAPFALLGLLSLCLFSIVVCFSGLRETLEAIPAQSAERGRGAHPRSYTRTSGLLVGCSRCSCRSCVGALPGARALALIVLVALAALVFLDVLAALAVNPLPVP